MSEMLKAIAHPARLKIIAGLLKNECNVSQIQLALRLPQSTISQHLKVLRNVGIIKGRREGTKVCYKVIVKWVEVIIRIIDKE
ncbi:MAG: winged helix-turn-helix transcriptional regulator [Candidatus Marinimicrobia bacterium]|nr:winged helix-turn-helix transcriptional regulator [Candidatus Neomarinimicrobiota bacterium]